MPEFAWALARNALMGFGGVAITLHVDKTGLPFYDALRLYGAIDLYVGTREDVRICDCGDRWEVSARARPAHLVERDLSAFCAVRRDRKKPAAAHFCATLRDSLISGNRIASCIRATPTKVAQKTQLNSTAWVSQSFWGKSAGMVSQTEPAVKLQATAKMRLTDSWGRAR